MHTNYIREETRIRHFTVLRSTGWCNPREGGWGVKDRALTAVKQHQQQGIQSLRVQNCKSKKNLGQDFTTVVLCFVVTVGNLAKCVITFICGWLVSCKEELDYASISNDWAIFDQTMTGCEQKLSWLAVAFWNIGVLLTLSLCPSRGFLYCCCVVFIYHLVAEVFYA